MKTVFKNSELPHLWAHQTQAHGRTNTGNIFFRRDTIYSYGTHFPIARHVEHKGQRCIFFTTQSYSVTTAGHMTRVRGSIPAGIPVFHVENPHWHPKQILDAFRVEIKTLRASYSKARNVISRENRADALLNRIQYANQFAEFFGYKTRFIPPDVEYLETLAEAKRQRQAARNERNAELARIRHERWQQENAEWLALREADEAKRKEREAELKRTAAERLDAWRNGGPEWNDFHRQPVACRIVGKMVETSYGASFPVSHALRAVPFVSRLLSAGETYQRNGQSIHLGHYTIDSIDESGTLHAGCHHVPRTELERLIGELQKLEIPLDIIST